jgi:hypothetical protein
MTHSSGESSTEIPQEVLEPELTRQRYRRAACVLAAHAIRRKANESQPLREVAWKVHAIIRGGPAELWDRRSAEAPDNDGRTRRNYSGLVLYGALELLTESCFHPLDATRSDKLGS